VGEHSQIDDVLIDKRWHSHTVGDVHLLEELCDTDHYLVVAKVRERPLVSK